MIFAPTYESSETNIAIPTHCSTYTRSEGKISKHCNYFIRDSSRADRTADDHVHAFLIISLEFIIEWEELEKMCTSAMN